MSVSKRIGEYMQSRGYNLSEVARLTGLNYQSLYRSLYSENFERDLRAEELIPLCILLNVDPRIFASSVDASTKDDPKQAAAGNWSWIPEYEGDDTEDLPETE